MATRQPRHEKKSWNFGMGARMAQANTYYRPPGVTGAAPNDKLKITGAERNLQTVEYKGIKYWSRIPISRDSNGQEVSIPLRLVADYNRAVNELSNALLLLITQPQPEDAQISQVLISDPDLGSRDAVIQILQNPNQRFQLAQNLLSKAISYDLAAIQSQNPYFLQEKNSVENQPAATSQDFAGITAQILSSEGKRARGGTRAGATGVKRASTPRGADAELEKVIWLMDSITNPQNETKFFEVDDKQVFKLISNKPYNTIANDRNGYATIPPLRVAARITKGGFNTLATAYSRLLHLASNDKREQIRRLYPQFLQQYYEEAKRRTSGISVFAQQGQPFQQGLITSSILQTTPAPSVATVVESVVGPPSAEPILGQGNGARANEPVITPAALAHDRAVTQQVSSGLAQLAQGTGISGLAQQQPTGISGLTQQQPRGLQDLLSGTQQQAPTQTGGLLNALSQQTSGISQFT